MDEDDLEPIVYRPATVARLLGGMSTKHCYDLIKRGELACIRCPQIRITRDSLLAYIERRRQRETPLPRDSPPEAVVAEPLSPRPAASGTPARASAPYTPPPADTRARLRGCPRCRRNRWRRRRH